MTSIAQDAHQARERKPKGRREGRDRLPRRGSPISELYHWLKCSLPSHWVTRLGHATADYGLSGETKLFLLNRDDYYGTDSRYPYFMYRYLIDGTNTTLGHWATILGTPLNLIKD